MSVSRTTLHYLEKGGTFPPRIKIGRRHPGTAAGRRRVRRVRTPRRWQLAVLSDCLTHHETLLCIARKNGKSALVALYVLGHLVGPLRRPGWRCGVLSVSRAKSAELLDQVEQIARRLVE